MAWPSWSPPRLFLEHMIRGERWPHKRSSRRVGQGMDFQGAVKPLSWASGNERLSCKQANSFFCVMTWKQTFLTLTSCQGHSFPFASPSLNHNGKKNAVTCPINFTGSTLKPVTCEGSERRRLLATSPCSTCTISPAESFTLGISNIISCLLGFHSRQTQQSNPGGHRSAP